MIQYLQSSGVILLLLLIPALAVAEGTAQLMPAGSSSSCVSYVQGNDGTGKEGPSYHQDATEYIYVHIQDPDAETIYFGFTRKLPSSKSVYYQILDPLGNIHCSGQVAESSSDTGYIADDGVEAYVGPTQIYGSGSGGYEAIECDPTMAGEYTIRFNVNHATTATPSESKYFIHPFDVTVASTVVDSAITGRLFAYRWHLNTNSGSNKACMQFYTWTPDSLVVMMDMNGMQPYGYTVAFNSFGVTNTGDISTDRKSSSSISLSIPEYRVFLTEPDRIVFPTGTPGEIEYIDISGCQADSSFCIIANATKIGEMNVYIDLDGNGVYDEGTRDVYFPYEVSQTGTICIPWDGIDGDGDPVSLSESGTVIVQFLAGIVHYPVYDPENNTDGFKCEIIRPASGLSPKMYFDNSSTSIGTINLEGCDSLCNVWTGNSGDRVMVNTWINTITSEDEESFSMSGFCPPTAVADSACTKPSYARTVDILENDWDRDNALDSTTVSLFDLSHDASQFIYDASGGFVNVLPASGDSSDMFFSYVICDKTSIGDGGALCDSGYAFIQIYSGCDEISTLQASIPLLRAFRSGHRIRIEWDYSWEAEGELWLERSIGKEGGFEKIWLREPSSDHPGNYLDHLHPGISGLVRYRWNWILPSGNSIAGKPIRILFSGNQEGRAVRHADINNQQLSVRFGRHTGGRLILSDLTGRELYAGSIHGQETEISISLDHNPAQSPYLILRWTGQDGNQEWIKILRN